MVIPDGTAKILPGGNGFLVRRFVVREFAIYFRDIWDPSGLWWPRVLTLSSHCSTIWLAQKASRPGITIVATARAAALPELDQPSASCPMSLVPMPQKNIAGADSSSVIFVCLRRVRSTTRTTVSHIFMREQNIK